MYRNKGYMIRYIQLYYNWICKKQLYLYLQVCIQLQGMTKCYLMTSAHPNQCQLAGFKMINIIIKIGYVCTIYMTSLHAKSIQIPCSHSQLCLLILLHSYRELYSYRQLAIYYEYTQAQVDSCIYSQSCSMHGLFIIQRVNLTHWRHY